MERERWRRIEALFHRAVDLDPSARVALLDAECDDPAMRAEVERLLRGDAGEDPLLDAGGALPSATANEALLGRVVGSYRLTEVLGAGGMGVVYAGERADDLFRQEVAVKLVLSALGADDLVRHFARERRALAALGHPNIARLYDGGTTEEGIPYLVMERVHGEPIDRWCDARHLPVVDRLKLFVKVAHAVHFAHTNLVVHRDLKPSNVLVDAEGEPKLLDFGIARLLDEAASPSEGPRTLTRIMTPEYASPEQLAGGAVTTASDVYSLGVVLYVLLTGRRPFHCDSQSPAAWQQVVAGRTPTRPSTAVVRTVPAPLHPDAPPASDPEELAARFGTTPARLRRLLSGDLDRIVLMALREEPSRRYSSAQELAEDVERHLDGRPVRAREESLTYRATRFVQRNRVAVGAAGVVALALLLGSLAAWRGERKARKEASRARQEAEHARIETDSFRGIAAFLEDQVLFALEAAAGSGHLERAEQLLLRQAAEVRRRYPDEVHLRANMLDALGRVALSFDRYETAGRLIDEALELRRSEFGEESLEVALSLESRGLLLYATGDLSAAEPVLRRRYELHRTLPPGTHTDVAAAANDLAAVLRNLGQLEEARRLHEEALELRRAAAPGSPAVAESLNNLAGVFLARGEPARAVELLEEAVEIRRAVLGEGHELTNQSLANLATAGYRAGERERVRGWLEQAEEGFRALGGVGADGLARVLSSLAALDLAGGDVDAAAARLEEALEIQRGRLPERHPALVSLLERRADLLARQGDLEGAAAAWSEVLAARRADLPADHPELGRSLREYGVFLLDADRLEDARAAFVEAVEILVPDGPNPLESARAQIGLGEVLGRLGRPEEGLPHARSALRVLESTDGARPEDLEVAREVVRELGGGT